MVWCGPCMWGWASVTPKALCAPWEHGAWGGPTSQLCPVRGAGSPRTQDLFVPPCGPHWGRRRWSLASPGHPSTLPQSCPEIRDPRLPPLWWLECKRDTPASYLGFRLPSGAAYAAEFLRPPGGQLCPKPRRMKCPVGPGGEEWVSRTGRHSASSWDTSTHALRPEQQAVSSMAACLLVGRSAPIP